MKSGLCIPNMVYLVQFVCLSDGVNLKVVATSIAEIERPVYHDVRNSMPHPTSMRNNPTIMLGFSVCQFANSSFSSHAIDVKLSNPTQRHRRSIIRRYNITVCTQH